LLIAGEVVGGHFKIVREIGRGAFGVVYEAQQLPLRRRVALKILRPEALESPDVVERFEREARLASSLDHPQAVRIYTCGEHTGGLPYLAMEYLEGENLKSHLGKRGRLSEKEVIEILTQTLAPLEEAHGKGIVHRDLKPENLFLCRMGGRKRVVKVLDFGIAKTFGGEWANSMSKAITRRDMLCGTPHYMAPEQVLSAHQITPAADVYALGCIVYEMLSGQPPFVAESPLQVVRMHVDAPVPALPAELGPSKLAQVLEKALRKNPSDRFEDAAAFARALRQLPSVPTPPWEAGSVERVAAVELRSRPARLTWDEGARRRLAGEAPAAPRPGGVAAAGGGGGGASFGALGDVGAGGGGELGGDGALCGADTDTGAGGRAPGRAAGAARLEQRGPVGDLRGRRRGVVRGADGR
jgi:serine/threonine protein kinase